MADEPVSPTNDSRVTLSGAAGCLAMAVAFAIVIISCAYALVVIR